jgi:hypothetical protein
VVFDYRIDAKRAGLEGVRLEDVTARVKQANLKSVPARHQAQRPAGSSNARSLNRPASEASTHAKPLRATP